MFVCISSLNKSLINQSKSVTIFGNLLTVMNYFLDIRFQRLVLNGQVFMWTRVDTSVPQGSINLSFLVLSIVLK